VSVHHHYGFSGGHIELENLLSLEIDVDLDHRGLIVNVVKIKLLWRGSFISHEVKLLLDLPHIRML